MSEKCKSASSSASHIVVKEGGGGQKTIIPEIGQNKLA